MIHNSCRWGDGSGKDEEVDYRNEEGKFVINDQQEAEEG